MVPMHRPRVIKINVVCQAWVIESQISWANFTNLNLFFSEFVFQYSVSTLSLQLPAAAMCSRRLDHCTFRCYAHCTSQLLLKKILNSRDFYYRGQFLAASAHHSEYSLLALPITACGLRLWRWWGSSHCSRSQIGHESLCASHMSMRCSGWCILWP